MKGAFLLDLYTLYISSRGPACMRALGHASTRALYYQLLCLSYKPTYAYLHTHLLSTPRKAGSLQYASALLCRPSRSIKISRGMHVGTAVYRQHFILCLRKSIISWEVNYSHYPRSTFLKCSTTHLGWSEHMM